jgi:hypothetical protein
MRTMSLFVVVFIIWIPTASRSEIRYVPLPELTGEYPGATPTTRTASFDLGVAPTLVRGAKISLVGGATVGVLTCPDEITLEPREFPWVFELDATMNDAATGGFWISSGTTSSEGGPFETLRAFYRIFGAGWTFLNDGTGQVDLRVVPTGYIAECIPTVVPVVAIVTEAYLVLDAEFPVPVETTTWGQIKALYEVDR